jgi:hypothetical protein
LREGRQIRVADALIFSRLTDATASTEEPEEQGVAPATNISYTVLEEEKEEQVADDCPVLKCAPLPSCPEDAIESSEVEHAVLSLITSLAAFQLSFLGSSGLVVLVAPSVEVRDASSPVLAYRTQLTPNLCILQKVALSTCGLYHLPRLGRQLT